MEIGKTLTKRTAIPRVSPSSSPPDPLPRLSSLICNGCDVFLQVTGAGDAFNGALLALLAMGRDLSTSIPFGLLAATLTVEAEETISPKISSLV
jgi:hypothetical protein